MMTIRRSEERGHGQRGWLDSRHTFSFADYHDPRFAGFSDLLVINEDRVAAGAGFPTHPHRDMEIVTYVLEGALEHKDSLGTGSVIHPGEIQRMSAGTGIRHSEYEATGAAPVHLLQIWILPERTGLPPSYEQQTIRAGHPLALIAGRAGGDGAVTVHQDVALWRAAPAVGEEVVVEIGPGRRAWVQVARGRVTVSGQTLEAGDGASIEAERQVAVKALSGDADVLVFDLR
jgi:redox-sensitive bicupin YhaK (pirin superfamily)